MNYVGRAQSRGRYETRHGPVTVMHGEGSLRQLGAELDALGAERPFVVTTRSLVRQAGLLAEVEREVGQRLAGRYGEADAHAPRPTVLAVARAAEAAGADCLVGFGGGSVTDTCRGAVLAMAEGLQRPDEFDHYIVRFDPFVGTPISGRALPMIALPTACSGGEFSNGCGLADPMQGTKGNYINDALAMSAVILDPLLTSATPDKLWTSSAIKTMSDTFEMIAAGLAEDPVADTTSLRAIHEFRKNLPSSREGDTDARLWCMLAAWIGFVPLMSRGMEAVFTIGAVLRHQVGAYFDRSHGEIAAALLPHVLQYELAHAPSSAVRPLLAAFDLKNVEGESDEQAIGRLVDGVRRFSAAMGMPSGLSEIGVEPHAFARIVETTAAILTKVCPVTSDDLMAILKAAL